MYASIPRSGAQLGMDACMGDVREGGREGGRKGGKDRG